MINLEPPRGTDDGTVSWSAWGLSRAGLSRYLASAQVAVGLRGEVEVLLASDKTLRRLNREWRGKDKATDVLSFPAAEEMAAVYGGDLAVSLETAQRQAEEHGHSLRDEVRILLLHGLLHLSGMDHEADAGEMAEREAELRKRLRLKSGLIARAGKHTSGAKASGYPKASSRPRGKSRLPSGMTNKKRMTKKQVAA